MGWDLMRCHPFKVLLALFVLFQLSINTAYCSRKFDFNYVDRETATYNKPASYRKKLQLKCRCVNEGNGIVQFIPSRNRSRQINARGINDLRFISLLAVSDSHGSRLRLQSEKYKTFLCFNKRGKLILRQHGEKKRCVFREKINKDHYTELQSEANPNWYVGFNRQGKPLKGYARRGSKRLKGCFQFTKLKVEDLPKTKTIQKMAKPQISILERFRFVDT